MSSDPATPERPGPRLAGVAALLLGLSLPFLDKPVHLDDANFLRLAEGARMDAWRPHAVSINWQGHLEPAFSVLSNPPGIAWWLAPVLNAPVWLQHLWMLAWLPLAAWGAWTLGHRFAGRGAAATVLLLGGPLGLLAAQAQMPDLPLFACVLAGLGGLTRDPGRGALGKRWHWALLVGLGACFRYSGAAVLPLVVLYALLHGTRRDALRLGAAALLPLGLLGLHDLHAYGAVHLLAMVGFQGQEGAGGIDLLHKGLANLAFLGAAGALPLLGSRVGRGVGAGLGGLAGGIAAVALGQAGLAAAASVVCCALGGAAVGAALAAARQAPDRRDALWLGTWLVVGALFLLRLRFAAARYWLPFLAPAVLLPLAQATRRQVALAAAATVTLGTAVALSDAELAHAQHRLAQQVLAEAGDETGLVAGHWGFQHHLEAAGWQPLEDDGTVPPGTLLARSAVSWPQESQGCLTPLATASVPARLPLRIHSADGGANLHSFVVSATPPVRVVAPWTLGGTDPLDTVTLARGCGP